MAWPMRENADMSSDGAGPQINGIPTWPDRQGHGTSRFRAEQSVECKLPLCLEYIPMLTSVIQLEKRFF